MVIRVTSLISGAADAFGATVIIDAFRAFTSAAIAPSSGVRRIVMIDVLEIIQRLVLAYGLLVLRASHPDSPK